MHARANPDYRTFGLGCLWCGARYAIAVRSTPGLQLPAQVAGQEMTRRQWYEHVLASWAAWGHKRAKLQELADGAEVPYEPMERGKKK